MLNSGPVRPRQALVVVAALVTCVIAPAAAADKGWVIDRLHIRLDIQPDGSILAADAVDVDFRDQPHHGIYRDLHYRFFYDAANVREYDIDLLSVTAADGRRHKAQTSINGEDRRFKIGDPDRTITGKETYRISYRIRHALNAFADHDELYWNATGTWQVEVRDASVVVSAPSGGINRVDCFEGAEGSSEHCDARFTPDQATFTATHALAEGEQMTIVTGLRKGVVAEPVPTLVALPRTVNRYFDRTPAIVTSMWAECALVIVGIAFLWWRMGRDRRYVSLHHSNLDNQDERVPLFGARPVAVEFEPVDKIRPGQMGLIIDERADTLDVTATIVDLGVRGYLKITEVPKHGLFGHKDWQLDRLKPADGSLLEYERIVLEGLFDAKSSRKLSDLKNKFHTELEKAKTALYKDAVDRGWFPRKPNSVRNLFKAAGVLTAALGVALLVYLGQRAGAGLIGLPVAAGGLLLAVMSGAMPRRSAAGTEVLHRTLGFAKYIRTAEVHQQAFAERANIFTEYLPYAIAFKCVDRWARAFKDIDMQQATAGWYSGTSGFNAVNFSSTLGSFSSSVSSTMTSTPGGSGGSGFSGGSSGGGGGGGGGGGW